MSIKTKMVLPMIILSVVTTIAVLSACIWQFSSYTASQADSDLESASTVMLSKVEEKKQLAWQAAYLVAGDAAFMRAMASGSRQSVLDRAATLQAEAGAEFITITDAQGTVIARTHEPANYGDTVRNQKNVAEALDGKHSVHIETGTAVRIAVRSGMPVFNENGDILGVVSVGYRLDTDSFVDEIKRLMGSEATVFLGDERISTTIQDSDGKRITGTKATEAVWNTVSGGNAYTGSAVVQGVNADVRYEPIVDDDTVIGMLFVGEFTSVRDRTVMNFVFQGLIVGLVILAISIPASLITGKRIVTPILNLVGVADAISAGDVDIEVDIRTKDETAHLARALERIIGANRDQAHLIGAIAEGDYTVEATLRSDKDVVGKALGSMIEMNNEVFAGIAAAAGQVALGSQQVSSGAQLLAQGSTEQSATVQQLLASVQDVTEKARDNAKMAMDVSALEQSIMRSAVKGTEQMARMNAAVKEINEASQAIGNVIKIIDDIAFQTNILALNAAVEAARAGQHGKGFAVVADEVRNLAGKSAEAAKSTGHLIENTITKAELGTRIADETTNSLKDIVSGIDENSAVIAQIATSSEEQSEAIGQINSGIDQVAQVVQQNSATAEESAAASQTMSQEAERLHSLVSRFRLRHTERHTK
ncbi:MAG: methyl-accepting chemotaxis protein [Oscillospiraceae bacterium]|jgi:methyl-accepting chemotaxis protein|nr:methyl-accepting chemotaxis protein [Oscillospiraceae bacterium]